MAEDAICILDSLGWTGEREVHVVGISLGGMIAQGTLGFLERERNMLNSWQNLLSGFPIGFVPSFLLSQHQDHGQEVSACRTSHL